MAVPDDLGQADVRPGLPRAEADVRRIAELESTLGEVLRTFVHPGHPGRACLQSGWIPVGTVACWRAVLEEADRG